MNKAVVANLLKTATAAAIGIIALFMLPADAAEVIEVGIVKMKFEPQQVKVKPGTTIKWINNEKRTSHSILFDQGELPESERFFPGESWQRTFEKPGIYTYRCGPHPEMTGTVEVTQ